MRKTNKTEPMTLDPMQQVQSTTAKYSSNSKLDAKSNDKAAARETAIKSRTVTDSFKKSAATKPVANDVRRSRRKKTN
jgi:hypothetical protein